MASNSNRRSGSSGRSTGRKRVVIGAEETARVRYGRDTPQVEVERRTTARQQSQAATRRSGMKPPSPSHQGKRLSSTKRDERERRQRIIRVRRWSYGAGAALMLGAIIWGCVALYNAPLFAVDKIVVTGNRHLSERTVLALAKVPRDSTLLRVSKGSVARRLMANPWIAAVSVDRSFPHTLRISVTERRPAVAVDVGGSKLWVLSRDGYWLGLRGEEESETIVVRDVPDAHPRPGTRSTSRVLANAARIASGLSPQLRARTRFISAPSIEKTAVITTDDIEIFFGDSASLSIKDRIAREILKKQKGRVVYINVRVVDSPTWRGLEPQP